MGGGFRDRERCTGSGSPSPGSGRQPDHPPPLWHTVLLLKSPELWAKVTAPAAHRTCDYLSTAELEQSGHCAKNAGPLAKKHSISIIARPLLDADFQGPQTGEGVVAVALGRRGLVRDPWENRWEKEAVTPWGAADTYKTTTV